MIQVSEVMTEAARLVGVEEELNGYFNSMAGDASAISPTEQRVADLLFSGFQHIENELALDYIPLMAEDVVVTADGYVEYDALSHNVVRIFCVEDEWGNSLKYSLFPTRLKTTAGKVRVIYSYAPSEKTFNSVSDYDTVVSKRLFVYGVAMEYSLAVGEFSAASAWDKKYKQAVQAAYRIRRCKKMRSRRWV